MRKYVTGLIACFMFAAQAVSQPISGIGDIKIGMSQEEFVELPDIKAKTIQDASNKKFESGDKYVWKKTSQSVVPDMYSRISHIWKIHTPEYVKYEFELATGVKNYAGKDTYEATVEFYKNELVNIRLDPSSSISEFRDALTEKYGKPIVNDYMKKEICQNGYGAKTEHNTGSLNWGWKGKGPVEASVRISSSGCGKNFLTSYTIKHSKKSALVDSLEKKAAQDAESEEKKSKATSSRL